MHCIYDFPDQYFESRLSDLGFAGLDCVLDVACGTGEWSRPLAALNKSVIGFDIDKTALGQARQAFKDLEVSRQVDFAFGNMLHLPVRAGTADGVFCFDSLMFANPRKVFREFYRVLRAEGIAYASINSVGWALYCIFHRGLKKRNFSKINMGLRMFSDTTIRRSVAPEYPIENTFFTPKDLSRLAAATGFKVLHIGLEASYKNPGFERYSPCFASTYLGAPCSLEILMQKRSSN